jgi:predicted enzyme related to lactoylglutathione lyase
MPVTAIASVWYPVTDWERAKAFYTGVLGLSLEAYDDIAGWAAYRVGLGSPPFFLVRKPVAALPGGGGTVTFAVTESGPLREQIVASGGRVNTYIQESAAVRIYTVYDPDGNVLELSEKK